jgi:hypothetical protein
MVFIDKETFSEIRGKAYFHKSVEQILPEDGSMTYYLLKDFEKISSKSKDYNYFISILWGDSHNNKLVDIFVYSGIKDNWKNNPEVSSWVIKKGIWRTKNPLTCGEGLILLGEEEKFRRKTKNIEEYLSMTLNINKLNKLL